MPFAAVVHPELHVHWPFEPHTPLRQLHDDGGLLTGATRQRPLPAMPSSHDVHPAAHAWQSGPKNPLAHASHDAPVKPAGQVQVPAAEQMPAPEHGGEHAADCMSRIEMLLSDEPEGSCERSAMESQRMRRSVDEDPAETAAQTLDDIMTEPAAVEVESREALLVGRFVKVDAPE